MHHFINIVIVMAYYACLVNYEDLLSGFLRKDLTLVSLLFSIQRYLKTGYSKPFLWFFKLRFLFNILKYVNIVYLNASYLFRIIIIIKKYTIKPCIWFSITTVKDLHDFKVSNRLHHWHFAVPLPKALI